MSGVALAGGYMADFLLGDPPHLHPVAGFGKLALHAEGVAYAPTRSRGIAYTGILVGLAAVGGELTARAAARAGVGRGTVLAAATWASLGGRSLTRAAGRLAEHIEADDLDAARAMLPWLCGRDPQALDADGLSRAALESVAENTSDAVVGALLWGTLAGPGGVLAYRAANTLDAMIGHRSARYADFGWAAARLDDLVNWPAARLAAVLTVLCAPLVGGTRRQTWQTVLRDGAKHPSPNAGRVEAAFAGALRVRLGGPLTYAGVRELRPRIGDGDRRTPTPADVHRATRLSLAVGALSAVTCAGVRALVLKLHRRTAARPPLPDLHRRTAAPPSLPDLHRRTATRPPLPELPRGAGA
ncbi:MAG: cobalamin biosynthesis protein [Solirubrobacteraceae bacterium]